MSLTRCLNLGLQALFLLVFALVMAQKMRGPQAPKFTPGEHVVEVEGGTPPAVEGGVPVAKDLSAPDEHGPERLETGLIVTEHSPIEPFAPYDVVPKALYGQESPAARDTEDHWDRQLKKFETDCPKPKLNL